MAAKIYTITLNGRPVYVGFTIRSLDERIMEHCKPNSSCILLSRAIKKYGKSAFHIELITEHQDAEFAKNVLEPIYIAAYGTHIDNGGYNMTTGGDGALGYKHSDESRAKIGAAKKGKKQSPEHRYKIGAAHKGKKRKPLSPETRAKIGEAQKGKSKSPEHRAKMSASHKGRKHSEETRAKQSAAAKNRYKSKETL